MRFGHDDLRFALARDCHGGSFADRPLDIKQTLDYAEQLTAAGGELAGLIDMQHVAVVGHSYGGYTALAMAGAQYDLAAFNARCAQLPADDPNTIFIVSELSRLGRSMLECMEILALATEKKIHLYAVKGNWQLENSLQSKIMAMVFSMAAEIERDRLSQRTKEALAARKRAGVKLGRPQGVGKSKLDQYRPEIEALLKNGATQTYIAKRYETTEATLSQWLEKHGLRRKRG